MESGYTAGEIALVLRISKRAVNKQAQKEGWIRKGRQFEAHSVPPDIQQAMIRKKYDRTELTPQELAEHFKIKIPPDPTGITRPRRTGCLIRLKKRSR
jgi:hypothetical protein